MIAGLVLAAGESSRMGTDKALLAYHGRTFLETILHALREAGLARIAVVLGHHANEIRRTVNLKRARVVINQEYRRGQTSSLQAGLAALPDPEIAAVILCLVDHPAISATIITRLIDGYGQSQAPVVIPTFEGRHGHPVLIARPLFAELLALGAGQGADTIIRKYRDATQFVEVENRGILLDVDDPETYRQLSEARGPGPSRLVQ